MPFATWPDRVDVPRNAARPLRYMDEYQLVSQGEVFYVTELLTKLEGLERGPAGNTSLTAAVTLARQMDRDQIVVVQETEYTGAGKHHNSQLAFARDNGIEVRRGDPRDNVPGRRSSSRRRWSRWRARSRTSGGCGRAISATPPADIPWSGGRRHDVRFLAADLNTDAKWVREHAARPRRRPDDR